MPCPMCGGPLRLGQPGLFTGEPGPQPHLVASAETASLRVTLAFWGAIEALESRVEILRSLALGRTEQAAAAEEDAKILRRLAMKNVHLSGPDHDEGRAALEGRPGTVSRMRPETGRPVGPPRPEVPRGQLSPDA